LIAFRLFENYMGLSYEKFVNKNSSLMIKKGEKIGIIGESGSGKSTVIDLIIGLYRPKSGIILIYEKELNEKNIKSWREKNRLYSSNDLFKRW
jgi:ABC-type multidrug transport system fused ATPase/permease subunit